MILKTFDENTIVIAYPPPGFDHIEQYVEPTKGTKGLA